MARAEWLTCKGCGSEVQVWDNVEVNADHAIGCRHRVDVPQATVTILRADGITLSAHKVSDEAVDYLIGDIEEGTYS